MSRPSGRHDRNVAPRNSVYGPSAAATDAGTGGMPSATMLSGGATGGGSAAGDAGDVGGAGGEVGAGAAGCAAIAAAMNRRCTRPVYVATDSTGAMNGYSANSVTVTTGYTRQRLARSRSRFGRKWAPRRRPPDCLREGTERSPDE